MTPIQQMFLGAAGPVSKTYIEDLFSTYLFIGNTSSHGDGTTQTIANGVDLTDGGLVWFKDRTETSSWKWIDSVRGLDKEIASNGTWIEDTATNAITAFNSSGFITGDNVNFNNSGRSMATFTFAKKKGFCDIVTYTGNGTAGRTVNHGLGSVPGCIIVKNLDETEPWTVYHRASDSSAPEDKWLKLDTDMAFGDSSDMWNDTAPTSTLFTVGGHDQVNKNTKDYVAYVFAHNDQQFGADGDEAAIYCGSYTGNGSDSTDIDVNIGWQPQLLIVKQESEGNWQLVTSMLPWPGFTGDHLQDWTTLRPNSNVAEVSNTDSGIYKTPTGFKIVKDYGNFNTNNDTHVFIAIRSADSGVGKSIEDLGGASKVFAIDKGSNSTTIPNFDADFPVELGLIKKYNANSNDWYLADRQATTVYSRPNTNYVPGTEANYTFDWNKGWSKDQMDDSHISYMWKKAAGFFTTAHFVGSHSAQTIPHDLGAVPEMIWIKNADVANHWRVYHAGTNGASSPQNYAFRLNDTNARDEDTNYWQNTAPTSTNFYVGTEDDVNEGPDKCMLAYLFGSVAGVSKVGYYTGTGYYGGSYHGGNQTIVTGFVPRFILIKWDGSGSWYVFDAERGLTSSGTNKYLMLNHSYAEIEPDDQWIYQVSDGANSGFWLNGAVTGNDINEGTQKYIYYAVA